MQHLVSSSLCIVKMCFCALSHFEHLVRGVQVHTFVVHRGFFVFFSHSIFFLPILIVILFCVGIHNGIIISYLYYTNSSLKVQRKTKEVIVCRWDL